MSTLNLEADIGSQLAAMDERKWTALQRESCMAVANAPYFAFLHECERMAEFVRLGVLNRATAADYLHQTAIYNRLIYEYGQDRVQKAVAAALESRAA
jgi:hypothetical protein